VKVISRAKPKDIPAAAFVQVMKADTQKLPAYVGVALGGGGYSVFRISKVSAGVPDAAKRASDAQQIASMQQDLLTYIELLKKKAKVSVNKSAFSSGSSQQIKKMTIKRCRNGAVFLRKPLIGVILEAVAHSSRRRFR
jgi:peptidyl-prolyl cis-trans isomerase D